MVPIYDRPPWKPVNGRQCEVRLSAFGQETRSERPERLTKTTANTSRYLRTDRRWGQIRICYRHSKNSTSKNGVQCGAVCDYWGNTIGEK
jgi:hypothetical protein